MQKIAIVGAGGGGLGAAYVLDGKASVTVFEQNAWLGGAAHTVDFPCADGVTRPIDMGVLLTDPWTYPILYALCDKYAVPTRAVGWSVGASFQSEAWWTGGPDTPLWEELREQCSRFELDTYRWKELPDEQLLLPVSHYLTAGGYDNDFAAKALAPMLCLLVVTRAGLVDAPIANILGLFSDKQLSFFNPTTWRLFPGGTRQYIQAMTAGMTTTTFRTSTPVTAVRRTSAGAVITTAAGEETFDQVIFGTQANLTLALLTDPTPEEKALLGKFTFQPADLYLHKDPRVLSAALPGDLCSQYFYDGPNVQPDLQGPFSLNPGVGLGLPEEAGPVLITGYNPDSTYPRPAKELTVAYQRWEHEKATLDSTIARATFHTIQGNQNTWHCGTCAVWASEDAVLASGMVVGSRPQLGGVFPFTDSNSVADYQQIEGVMFPPSTAAVPSPRVGFRRTT
jgi:predicted NAD/FAD-binding protein